MKKLLLASTALIGLAGAAAADVTISGYGRFGITYDEGRVGNETQVHTRLRFNIDAKTETDSGVVFGGRIRAQYDSGSATGFAGTDINGDGVVDFADVTNAGRLSPALLYVSYEGLRVEVGNANTAFDSAALLYDSEMGLRDTSFGDAQSSFFSFSTDAYDQNRMGVYAAYDMAGFSGKISYITPDQTTGVGVVEETSIALSYESDLFTVSAAAAQDAAGISGNDIWFIGGAYSGLPNTTIGLNYIDEGTSALGETAVLYANYTMGATTLRGYISNNSGAGNATDTGVGIGADYDLGGAKLTGSIQRGYTEDMYADFGVRFDF